MRKLNAVLLALILVMLSACAEIPTSGPIDVQPQAGREEPIYEVLPRAPQPGEEPVRLVLGFLGAMASAEGRYEIAREFLTEQANRDWKPTKQAMVYRSQDQPQRQGDTVVLETHVMGRLDERGTFTRSQDLLQWDFKLVKVGKDWRISNPPVGLMLASDWFATNFAATTLYFFEPVWQAVVPDVFYVPKGKRNPQFLVNQLALGPSEWLRPAVVSAVPSQGRALANLSTNVVEVSIALEPGSQEQVSQTELAAQIALTFSANHIPARYLTIMLGGQKLDLPGRRTDGSADIEQFQRFLPTTATASTTMFGIAGKNVVTIIDRQGQADVSTPNNVKMMEQAETLAVSKSADRIAYVGKQGSHLWWSRLDPGGDSKRVLEGTGLLAPQFFGTELWTIGTLPNGATAVFRSVDGQRAQIIKAPELDDVAVTSYRISPDGVRLVVSGVRERKPFVAMLRIERTEQIDIKGMKRLDLGSTPRSPAAVSSLAWESQTTLIAMATTAESKVSAPFAFDVNVASVDMRATVSWQAKSVVTSPYNQSPGGRRVPIAAFGGDKVWRYTGPSRERPQEDFNGWPLYASGLSFICYPG